MTCYAFHMEVAMHGQVMRFSEEKKNISFSETSGVPLKTIKMEH